MKIRSLFYHIKDGLKNIYRNRLFSLVKEAAEFVTTDIYDDGIKHAMEHYGLI